MKQVLSLLACAAFLIAAGVSAADGEPVPDFGKVAAKPLFRDPVFDGAADPVVVYSGQSDRWTMLYTNRRANVRGENGVAWVHGTRIGIAESIDGGATWRYAGEAGIELSPDMGGKNATHWAPDVVRDDDGIFHMFLTVVPGIFETWDHPRYIVHLTSRDLRTWSDPRKIPLPTDRAMDASLIRLPSGGWRMFYNNESDRKSIWYADSPDLENWTDHGKVISDEPGEGPKAFRWHGKWWLITDVWHGLAVYRSDDGEKWIRQPGTLLGKPGKGLDDEVIGGHPDVVVSGDRAYLFYFTHPGRKAGVKDDNYETRRSSIQVAELHQDGDRLTVDRDAPTRIALQHETQPVAPDEYVFAYFIKNGEDGLHLAISKDGYKWEKLNGGASYLKPAVGNAKLMRDPCVTRGPDGTFHMVWTSGWNENSIGYASSKDLVHWSAQKELPVMAHTPGVLNAWAPEIVYDDKRGEFLIFWSSTIPGAFPRTAGSSEDNYNHRIYATTTRDFVTFTPTALFYDPGFSVIDATFVRAKGRDMLLIKDETRYPPRKYLQLAAAPDLHGPFGKLSEPISPAGVWVEGPTALQVGDDVIIYYDAYRTEHYGALRSRDLVHWEDVTAMMKFPDEGTPERMRHGTAIAIPGAVAANLRAMRSGPSP